MEFRPRDYSAEEKSHALPRSRSDKHPLSAASSPSHLQIVTVDHGNDEFFDPLRASDDNGAIAVDVSESSESNSTAGPSKEASLQVQEKEWNTFKRFLMQRFPISKMVSVSSSMSDVIIEGGGTKNEKSSSSKHLEELEDPEKFREDGAKTITRQEYVSRLQELREEIVRAWNAGDRVTTLKLSIKVARLLLDTSVSQFYGTVFVLATDVMDMLGDMVWERIKQKAEFSEDGTKFYSLPAKFKPSDVCSEAKETCYNWFCKIGAIRELLPRIYLELAILPCRRFLDDRPEDCLQRLVLMIRGLADPLASAYCRLYLARCMQKLPSYDIAYLVRSVNDIKTSLSRILSAKGASERCIGDSKSLIVSLMEPTIEFSMKCILKGASEGLVDKILMELGLGRNEEEFGNFPCVSVVLHHLLKELPSEVISSRAVKILQLIEGSCDYSFNQCLNYRLLGFRIYENKSQTENTNVVVDKVIEVAAQYDSLDEYLKVVDAFVDIILENEMDNHLNTILEGISKRASIKGTAENEQVSLQSILVKLLSHYNRIEDMIALNHFLEILDIMYGSSRTIVNMNILNMATRNGYICDRTTIQLLFEISQALYDSIDFVNVKDADNQPARLISRFVNMVDYGLEMERHLTFLVECRGAFGGINGLKEILIHSSNCLVIKALKHDKKHLSFIKSCIAFCEVTLPSISSQISQLSLYLETAEVALLGGLVSHSDGLINSALSCFQSLDVMDGSKMPRDVDGILSLISKLCGLLVLVPGNPKLGAIHFLKSIISLINSHSWLKPKMRAKVFCSVVTLSATLSQNKLPYHPGKVLGNDYLFYGDLSYVHELSSFTKLVLENLVDSIQQEPSSVARGSLALEACNCIASSFKPSQEIYLICSKLMETAKSCLSSNDRYLQLTVKFLDKRVPSSSAVPQIAA